MNAEKKIEKKYVETPLMKQYYSIKAVHPDAILIIGKTKCDGIQNQMRLFGGRVSPKRKATKISHTHTKKHRSNGF